MALFMKQVCANTCVYYKVQRFHFWGEYSHPSVTAVQTLLLPSAHSATSVEMLALISHLDKANIT